MIEAINESGGEADLGDVADMLGMPEADAETALRFSGFLVNGNKVR